jgi:hypothetical protein
MERVAFEGPPVERVRSAFTTNDQSHRSSGSSPRPGP